jgi:hypothetical protein
MSDAKIIFNSKTNLKVQYRNDDRMREDPGKLTTLHITRCGEQLNIYISIETKYPKRTTYTDSTFHCGPKIADMIADVCTGEAPTGNAPGVSGITSKAMEHSHE